MRKTILACVAVALVAGTTTATAASLITSRDIEDGTIKNRDIAEETIRESRLSDGVQRKLEKDGKQGPKGDTGPAGSQGPAGAIGSTGPQGTAGAKGDKGKPAQTNVSNLSGPFEATNGSVSLTSDGVEFGPYGNGGNDGGSLYYTGLNGKPLSNVKNLAYYARYVSGGDTGGVGVPYLRIFTEGTPDDHSVIFSPNTQSPDADVDEGPFHEWVATSGVWRYDDDGGSGGEYGLNGAPFSEVITDHGTETISGIYISTGFSAGNDLAALLRWMEINGETYAFRG